MATQLEKRVAWAEKAHGAAIARRLGEDGGEPSAVLARLAEFDPTAPKFKLLGWLAARWAEGMPDEDLPKAKESLELFLSSRPALPAVQRDINTFRSLPALDAALEPFRANPYLSESEKDRRHEAELLASGAAVVLLDNDEVKVVELETEEASKWFGRGTRWCTAAEKGNAFGQYRKQGQLIVFLSRRSRKRWQAHPNSGQFMDELDRPATLDDLLSEVPSLVNWKKWSAVVWHFGNVEQVCDLFGGSDPERDQAMAMLTRVRGDGFPILMRIAPAWFDDDEFVKEASADKSCVDWIWSRVPSANVEGANPVLRVVELLPNTPARAVDIMRAPRLTGYGCGVLCAAIEDASGPTTFRFSYAAALFREWSAAAPGLFDVANPQGVGDLSAETVYTLANGGGLRGNEGVADGIRRGVWPDDKVMDMLTMVSERSEVHSIRSILSRLDEGGVLRRLGWRRLARLTALAARRGLLAGLFGTDGLKHMLSRFPVAEQVRYAMVCPEVALCQLGVDDSTLAAALRAYLAAGHTMSDAQMLLLGIGQARKTDMGIRQAFAEPDHEFPFLDEGDLWGGDLEAA